MLKNALLLSALACCSHVILATVSLAKTSSPSLKHQATKPLAIQITAANAAELNRRGPDAIGGIGDWFISNGTLCAIVSDPSRESEFSSKGGSLIDLGFCERADDHYSFANDLLQGSRLRPLDGQKISIELDRTSASLVVLSHRDGAQMSTRYTLNLATPTQLHIKKKLTLNSEDPRARDFNFLSFLNFNYHSLEPFVFSSQRLENTTGFQHEDFVNRGESAIRVAAHDADTIITISPPSAQHGISYGWHLKSAQRVTDTERYDVPTFVLADDASNAMLILTDTFYIGDGRRIGWLQLPQMLMLGLDNAALETEEVIFVGKRGDVASITDQFFADHALVSGRVDATDVAIHIRQSDGTPLTHVRPNGRGEFHMRLPVGDYQLKINASASRTIQKIFTVATDSIDLGDLKLPKAATLELPQGQAMRLVFEGLNDTQNPNFVDTFTEFSVKQGDELRLRKPVSQVFLAGIDGDKKSIELAPGKYRVYATRGPEFSLEQTEIRILPQSKNTLKIAIPKRQLSTPNYIASDLHVHSGISFDNTFSETERVRTFVAEHGEVLVASEHDVPVDYLPLIKKMGVHDRITAIAAAEITSLLPSDLNPYSGGHINAFPYHPEPHEFRRGMINHENRRWREVIHELKLKQSSIVTQLNHPRSDLRLSGETLPKNWKEIIDNGHFLDHMGHAAHPYNPHKPLHEHPNKVLVERDPVTGRRDIDFDLIELINPDSTDNDDRIKAVRLDWLSLLKQGERLVGTANSDSHNSYNQVAVPRTMVAMDDDQLSIFDQYQFLNSLKSGNAYGTTGPMLEVSFEGTTMGQTYIGTNGHLELSISSADWIAVTKAKIQINGKTISQYDLDPADKRTMLKVPMTFDKDSFITVEVSGPKTAAYSAVYPHLSPYAFTNPIYVDYNGDGEWNPPGL